MEKLQKKIAVGRAAVGLSVFIVIVVVLSFSSMNQLEHRALLNAGLAVIDRFTARTSQTAPPSNCSAPLPAFRLLIGILTLPQKYERRNLLRLVYGLQTPKIAQIDVKFVFCNLTNEEHLAFIALEIKRYDDIIILNCTENMDSGKTYTYFSSVPHLFGSTPGTRSPPYDYVMKADDDTFVRLAGLEETLKDAAREDMYYGFLAPCDNMDAFTANYMAGMAYVLSWDLAEWIRSSNYAKSHQVGPEDLLVGDWFRAGKVAKNRYNNKPTMYDFPGAVGPDHTCSHDFIPGTVAVHRVKRNRDWLLVLSYFNYTKDIKPSSLYHIP
ncbi:Beta-1-3-galactosyltransferase [Nymphaea thermarum]|nr:Beta-1-3-galactosyltransferase [Nymphaea thermarum]